MSASGALLMLFSCRGEPAPPAVPRGTELVLRFAQDWGVAWPPAWCLPPDARSTSCLRRLPDGSDAVLYWTDRRRPFSVTRTWSELSPIRGIDLRDSLREALEHRGARRLNDVTGPDDPEHHVHHTEMRWCLEGALVAVVRTWQDGHRLEWVNMLVGAVPTPWCAG
jgi:hypothetical protein